MNPIRRKLVSLMTEVLQQKIEVLEPGSPQAQELSTIDLDKYIKQDIETVCNSATMAEIMRILFLGGKLRKAIGQERETINNDLKVIADVLIARLQSKSVALRLPKSCLDMLFD